jgi:hypothetical protein
MNSSARGLLVLTQGICPYQGAMLLQTCKLYGYNVFNESSNYDKIFRTKCVQLLQFVSFEMFTVMYFYTDYDYDYHYFTF